MCVFCLKKANRINDCEAIKVVVTGKTEVLVVHRGHHTHELQEALLGEEEEKYKIAAVLASTQGKQVR